jgi:hypothetical protein
LEILNRRATMPRITLDLNNTEDRSLVSAEWKYASGYIPGEPNEGLLSETLGVDARLPEYDDSSWKICPDIRQSHSKGFTFGWYRTRITIPETIKGQDVTDWRIYFETNADNYGEVWVNGQIDRTTGVIIGLNLPQRIEITGNISESGTTTIACLVANGPLGEPRGGIFLRHATLALEMTDN